MQLAPPGSEPLGPVVYMLCEFQLVDAETEASNEAGDTRATAHTRNGNATPYSDVSASRAREARGPLRRSGRRKSEKQRPKKPSSWRILKLRVMVGIPACGCIRAKVPQVAAEMVRALTEGGDIECESPREVHGADVEAVLSQYVSDDQEDREIVRRISSPPEGCRRASSAE